MRTFSKAVCFMYMLKCVSELTNELETVISVVKLQHYS